MLVPTASVAVAGETVTGAAETTVIVAVAELPSLSITLSVVVPAAIAESVIDVLALV